MKIVLTMAAVLLGAVSFGQLTSADIEKTVKAYISKTPVASPKKISLDRGGTIFVPETYSNTRTGTKDSERGHLRGSGPEVGYDIGHSAGTLMSAYQVKDCSAYYNASINGYNTWIGISKDKLMITITDADRKIVHALPANFWANINNEAEMNEVLKIVFSYKPVQ